VQKFTFSGIHEIKIIHPASGIQIQIITRRVKFSFEVQKFTMSGIPEIKIIHPASGILKVKNNSPT
jgi:hypothetical protein